MTHRHVLRRLSEYLEGELPCREEERLEAHLAECASCAAELRALRRSIEWLRTLPAPEPPEDLAGSVLARLRAGEAAPRGFLRWRPGAGPALGWLTPLAAAAAIGAFAWLGPRQVRTQLPQVRAEIPAAALAAGAARDVGRLRGVKIVPAGVPTPSMEACLERSRSGGPTDDCASWYAWFVSMALEDSRGFLQEVAGLPPAARDPWLERVSEFAARSGSAPLVGDRLRSSRDPGAARIARHFERGVSVVSPVGWQTVR